MLEIEVAAYVSANSAHPTDFGNDLVTTAGGLPGTQSVHAAPQYGTVEIYQNSWKFTANQGAPPGVYDEWIYRLTKPDNSTVDVRVKMELCSID